VITRGLAVTSSVCLQNAHCLKVAGSRWGLLTVVLVRDQQCFIIPTLTADWHELMVPEWIIWPSITRSNERYTTARGILPLQFAATTLKTRDWKMHQRQSSYLSRPVTGRFSRHQSEGNSKRFGPKCQYKNRTALGLFCFYLTWLLLNSPQVMMFLLVSVQGSLGGHSVAWSLCRFKANALPIFAVRVWLICRRCAFVFVTRRISGSRQCI